MTKATRLTCALMALAVVATPVYAATLDPLQNIIDEIVDFITGPGGIALGTIVIAATGLGAAMGRFEWRTFFMAFVGLVMVFGASTIVGGIVSTSGGSSTAAPASP